MSNQISLRRFSSTILAFSALGGMVAFGCGKQEGGEGEDCYKNKTCDEGLVCASNTCVNLNAGTSGGDGDGDGGVDAAECFSCADAACGSQRSACDDTKGCDDLVDCMLGCGSDITCRGTCSVAGLTAHEAGDAGLAAGNYVSCAFTSCSDECSPSVGTTESSGTTDTGGGGLDLNACLGCAESSCSERYDECEGIAGCLDLLECGWACTGATDASCAADCANKVTGSEASAATVAVSDLLLCQASECVSECAYEADTTSGDSGSSTTNTSGDTSDTGDTGDTEDTGGPDLEPNQVFAGSGVSIDAPEVGAVGNFFVLEDSVENGALVSDGLYHTDLDPPGDSTEPSTFEGSSAPCVSGSVTAVTTATGANCETTSSSCDWGAFWGGGIGLSMNETDGVASAWDGSDYSGFRFALSGSAGGVPIRFFVEDTSGNQFCTQILTGQSQLRWSDLDHECWDPTSLSLDPTKIKQISWQFVPDASYVYTISNFCVAEVAVF